MKPRLWLRNPDSTWAMTSQRWIVAALRHHKFFLLEDLNQAIGELLTKLNHRLFCKREWSRATVFEGLDGPALKPLPTEPFDLSEWSRARLGTL